MRADNHIITIVILNVIVGIGACDNIKNNAKKNNDDLIQDNHTSNHSNPENRSMRFPRGQPDENKNINSNENIKNK